MRSPRVRASSTGCTTSARTSAADLTCQPIDLSLKNYGKSPTTGCQYYVTFKNGKFVVMNNGKPYFGKLVGDPALLEANKTGTAADVTTTSTP